MKVPDQKKVWNKIAPEWYLFKDKNKAYINKFQQSILEFLKDQKGNILDLGAGTGRYLTKIKNGKMILVDFSKEMIKIAKQNAKKKKIEAEFQIANSSNLPFKDNFFNAAICISIVQCIPDSKNRIQTFKELYRVLKPGAKAKIGTWNKEGGRFKNKPKESCINWTNKGERYYYFYSKDELKKELENVGFKIIKDMSDKPNIDYIIQKPK